MNSADQSPWVRLADDFLSEAATQLEESRQIRERNPHSLGTTLTLLKAMSCLRCARLVLEEAAIALGESPKGRRAR